MNIAEILKDYPRGTSLYSSTFGELSLWYVLPCSLYPIYCKVIGSGSIVSFAEDGKRNITDAEPTLFPSKDQRDWSKFGVSEQDTNTRPKPQFKPFEKVLVRDGDNDRWQPAFFSVLKEDSAEKFGVIDGYIPTFYSQCIPYNDGTKHLLGTYDPYKPKA